MIRFILPDLKRLESSDTEAVVLFRFDEKVPFRGIGSLIDWRLHGHLSKITIEDFFTGAPETPLLMPPGRFLPQRFLLLMGLGPKGEFSKSVYDRSLEQAFDVLDKLNLTDIAMALPGRIENALPGGDAIDWFIDVFKRTGASKEVCLIEPAGAQKTMVPAVERWRLRNLVPEA